MAKSVGLRRRRQEEQWAGSGIDLQYFDRRERVTVLEIGKAEAAAAARVIESTYLFRYGDPKEGHANGRLKVDPKDVEAKISPRTKAIMPVHMVGLPANMNRIMRVARKHKVKVLEDAAQAFGGRYKGGWLGTIGD